MCGLTGQTSQVMGPNHQRWYAKWKLSRNTVLYTPSIRVFARLAPTCVFSVSVLINQISASELSRKFLKSVVVGWGDRPDSRD